MILALDYTREDRANAAEVVTATTPGMAQYLCGKYCTFANFYAPAAGQVSDAYSMPNRTRFDGWGASSTITVGLTDALNLQSISAFRRYNQIWVRMAIRPTSRRSARGRPELRFFRGTAPQRHDRRGHRLVAL
jgi:hypothetical protein